ncbi:hypothetical protein LguiB_008758 [Lonicera macranthoides]
MSTENKSKSNNNNKRKQRYLPHNKAVKKGGYPLKPGVQGFFITCDGGRERQASQEAINVLDSFYEELVNGTASKRKLEELPNKPVNKKIKFAYSDSDDDDDNENGDAQNDKEDEEQRGTDIARDGNDGSLENEELDPQKEEGKCCENKTEGNRDADTEDGKNHENKEAKAEEQAAKEKCLEKDAAKFEKVISDKRDETSIDKLIEAELEELKDKSKRLFNNLDSGCNGVIFIQMRKRDGDPSPSDIVRHTMTSVASTRKHMSRFILRVLPVEVTCYPSEEEISRAIKPLIERYFPAETQTPQKFAVLYEARANTGVDRMKIINAVAKSIPEPHKVDLNNPDRSIVVQIARTVCSIGVVEKYKELAKYNLRQLQSSKQ